jgi:CBS domain-containing protein
MKSTVQDVMTRIVVTVSESAPFKEIVAKLDAHGVSALPVIGSEGAVVGVVSEADLMLKEELHPGRDRPVFETRRKRRERAKMGGKVAADLMSAPAVTIGPEAPLAEAARIMHEHRVKRLPVVDRKGGLIGILSRRDVLGVFLRSDEEIRVEIVHRVLGRILSIDASRLRVHVAKGVVTLEGIVERMEVIPLVEEFVQGVEGVVAVEARLSVAFDDSELRREQMRAWGPFMSPHL